MQVIGVRGVIVGGQGRREQRAGAVADFAQERRLGIAAFPVAHDGDAGAVGEAEAGNVDRIGLVEPAAGLLPLLGREGGFGDDAGQLIAPR